MPTYNTLKEGFENLQNEKEDFFIEYNRDFDNSALV